MRLSAWEKLHFNMGVLQVDEVLGDRNPGMEDLKALRYTSRVIAESMRLYPQPPVLIRRALKDDMFGDIKVRLQHSIGLFVQAFGIRLYKQLRCLNAEKTVFFRLALITW